MPVDRADVLQAEVFEEHLGLDDVLDAALDAVQGLIERGPDQWGPPEHRPDQFQRLLVLGTQPQRGKVLGKAARRRGVRPAVVVYDDDDRSLARGDVVERFPAHPARQGPVADDGHDTAMVLPAQGARLGQPVRIGKRGRSVAVLDEIVLGLGPAGVAGQAPALAQRGEVLRPAGQHLVHVGLVTGVPDQRVPRAFEHPVQSDRQLYRAEVGTQVPPGTGDGMDEKRSDFVGQRRQLCGVKTTDVFRAVNALKQTHPRPLLPAPDRV